ncbi:MAG: hypothetical protein ACOX1O_04870 [Eggerthellaceae bacterium]|jgi:hypothetical protein
MLEATKTLGKNRGKKRVGMNASTALKKAVQIAGVRVSHIGGLIGKSRAWGNAAITSENPSIDTMSSVAHLCGYRVSLIPYDYERKPGEIVIDAPKNVSRIEPLGKPYI